MSTRTGTSIAPAREPLLERLAFEQFHRDERRIGADVVDRADVRVVERRGGPRFALKAFQGLPRHADAGREHFDRHHPFETSVGGAIDLPHAARRRAATARDTGRYPCQSAIRVET